MKSRLDLISASPAEGGLVFYQEFLGQNRELQFFLGTRSPGSHNLLQPNIFRTKNFSGPQTFRDENSFDPTLFLTLFFFLSAQLFILTKNFIGPDYFNKVFLDPKSF